MPPPRKSLGQHFLHDPRILARIADAVGIETGDTVLEVGPGRGGLTRELLARASRVVAIEKDRELWPDLRSRFPALELIEGDALQADWHALVGPGRFRVAGNIPYNITSPLLEKALLPPRPAVIVFLVQQEVAARVGASSGGPEYGALSVGIQAVARVERLFAVPAGAFRPRPNVESAVVRFTPLGAPLVADADVADFRRFVVGLFGFRRKQLARGLRELTGLAAAPISGWLAALGIAETRRPQELDPAGFVRLFRARPTG
jgi:16S rRNA (adenine1518-N6/adenine1519-N6)-dimethyltransferase